jgi:hypothetical protein
MRQLAGVAGPERARSRLACRAYLRAARFGVASPRLGPKGGSPSRSLNGARRRICTRTGNSLNVVSLLVGLRDERDIPGRSLPPAHCIRATEGRSIYFALGDVKWSTYPVTSAFEAQRSDKLSHGSGTYGRWAEEKGGKGEKPLAFLLPCTLSHLPTLPPLNYKDKGRTQKAEVRGFLRVGPLHYFSICHSSL